MNVKEKAIPKELLDTAEAIAVFPDVIKAAFLVGGRGGDRGVADALRRRPDRRDDRDVGRDREHGRSPRDTERLRRGHRRPAEDVRRVPERLHRLSSGERLEASPAAATAFWPAHFEHHVTDLSRGFVETGIQFAVENKTSADALNLMISRLAARNYRRGSRLHGVNPHAFHFFL